MCQTLDRRLGDLYKSQEWVENDDGVAMSYLQRSRMSFAEQASVKGDPVLYAAKAVEAARHAASLLTSINSELAV